MGDKPNVTREKIRKLHLETTVSRKTIVKKYKRNWRNIKRKNRRKRSRKTYFNMLKKDRIHRGTQELCNSLQEFSVVDIDMKPMLGDINRLPDEVSEWQKQDQIAYWKSRSISLEIENKILRQHLRNVYAQQIEYYENKGWQELPNTSGDTSQEVDRPIPNNKTVKGNKDKKKIVNERGLASTSKAPMVLPNKPKGKNRLEEMEKIYGDMATKIMGMETAIQLNYERLVEKGSPVYWPNLPLKL